MSTLSAPAGIQDLLEVRVREFSTHIYYLHERCARSNCMRRCGLAGAPSVDMRSCSRRPNVCPNPMPPDLQHPVEETILLSLQCLHDLLSLRDTSNQLQLAPAMLRPLFQIQTGIDAAGLRHLAIAALHAIISSLFNDHNLTSACITNIHHYDLCILSK